MIRLIIAAMRQAIWPWGIIGLAAWLAIGNQLIRTLGDYLAWVSFAPIMLMFRFAGMSEQRRRNGWRMEERLRDSRGWRLPSAEFLAAVVSCALILGVASFPAIAASKIEAKDTQATADFAEHPLVVAHSGYLWRVVHPHGRLPANSRLALLIEWDHYPKNDFGFTPGKIYRRDFTAAEAEMGEVTLNLPPGARIHSEFARAEVEVPYFDSYPKLLLMQWLFFVGLFGINLLLVRLRIRASLASLASLAIASLGLWQASAALPVESGQTFLINMMAAVSSWVPDLRGLYAVGLNFELRVGASGSLDILWWLGIGGLALLLSFRARYWETS